VSEDDPVLRVVRGAPSADELAALLAVVVPGGGRPARPDGGAPSAWVRSARPGAAIGALPGHRGRDSWRTSALPR
jgi:hypothetical protein